MSTSNEIVHSSGTGAPAARPGDPGDRDELTPAAERKLRQGREHWLRELVRLESAAGLKACLPPRGREEGRVTFDLEIAGELYGQLQGLTGGGPFLIYTTLLAALKTCIFRYTGSPVVAVGSPLRRDEGEPMPLSAVLPIVDDLDGAMTGKQLLGAVRQTLLSSYAHQGYPLDRLAAEMGWAGAPLFDVTLALTDIHGSLPEPGADLAFTFSRQPSRLAGRVEVSLAAYGRRAVERFAGHFTRALAGLLTAINAPIVAIEVLSEAERQQLTREWVDTRGDAPLDACAHELFAEQARRHPTAAAVTAAGLSLTYAELDARANALARHLRGLGVGPEVRVGSCLPRGADLIVGVLGILKAGGAFVPLDPGHPEERLATILEETAAPLVLTHGTLLARFPKKLRAVCLDRDAEAIAAHGPEPLPAGTGPDNLAYVIYTSGSTGRPKGVQVAHRGLCNMIAAQIRIFDVRPDSRVLQFAAASFDASVSEVFMALHAGAALCPVEQESMLTGAPLGRFLAEQGVTVATLPPSALASVPVQPLPALRTLIVAGEDCPESVVADWIEGRRFVNAYGPTEATVCATAAVYDPAGWTRHIGRPIANTRVRVLGAGMQPVPAGIAGELYLGGAGLARGYSGRPDLTAERFVPDPFAEEPGARLYRSGDLARHRPDGTLEFLGRRDRQVKVRGFRIELGEIEAVLAQHPAVREAAVLVRRDASDAWIAAYLVHKPEARLSVADLHRWVQQKLPEYMVPSVFVPLEVMPLTAHGKVDQAALLALSARPVLDLPMVAPRGPIEEVLATIWAQILQVEEVGIHDNFFELGGHSLRAVQVISRVSDTFQVELPLRSLFEPPTVAGLAQRVQEALLGSQDREVPALEPAGRDGDLPLSFAQQRLWFLHQLLPESAAYNVPATLRLSGAVQPELLERVLAEVVRRHEVLRTTFRESTGQPVQVVAAPPARILRRVDLSGLPAGRRESTALELARAEIGRPFDLARGPLLRAVLLRLDEQEHAVAFTLHHIASDGWSMGVLVREVAALYDAFSKGRPSPLPELPLQYADYAVWQRRWLSGETLEAQLAFWRRQLAGAPQVLELPTDRPRSASASSAAAAGSRGAKLSFLLSPDLLRRLRKLGQQRGCTPFMTLLAAFQVLLYRHAQQDDLLIGSPVANRGRSALEGLIGFFINTLVFRGRPRDEQTFLALLAGVRETALQAYAHQDLPFEKLIEELQPDRDLSRPPLFQVMLALQNAPVEALAIPGLRLSPLGLGNAATQFELTLNLSESERGLAGLVEYDAGLFDATTVGRLVRHFEALLDSATARPEQALEELAWLAAEERHQLLREWGAPAEAGTAPACLHERFAAQAARTPEALALIAGAQRLTYRDLDRRANRLAHYLRGLGVGPEVRVGLSMERSPGLLVGLLAILKAGGAYVPLDPQLPEQRTAFILEDAQAPILLAQRASSTPAPAAGPARLVFLEEADGLPESASATAPPSGAGPDNLAFVIYTSGSTGRPKGVLVPHRGVVNWALAAAGRYGITAADRMLQFASLSFDVAADELFPTWFHGATLVLRSEEALATGEALAAWVEENGITIANLPTAFWQQWARDLADRGRSLPAPLRLVIVGSERASSQVVRLWKRLEPKGARWINAYGPTETSVGTTVYELPAIPADAPADPPIGRPVRGTRVHLLDARGAPVPAGVPGEIHIGGAGVTRGYLGRPEVTAASFVPDPFGEAGGDRLYRTGDRALWLPDGNLQFLSRTDHQVKIRGFRVELGEIEAALHAHPAVRDAAVVLQQEGEAGARLAAFLVAAEGSTAPAATDLRALLRQSLPDYMVPAAFVFLESLPTTPGGKVDRTALAGLAATSPEPGEGAAAPRTQIEEVVAAVFGEVLGAASPGAHDSFFELGGHSLLAAQAVSRLRDAFRVELPLRDLFDTPTVAGLAARIEALCQTGSGGELPPLRPADRSVHEGGLPLSFPQARLWFFDQLQPGSSSYNCPAFTRIKGALDVPALLAALTEITRRHEVLRTTFGADAGRPYQRIGEPRPLPPRVVDLAALPAGRRDAESRRLASQEAGAPFDLAAGPLLRFTLLRLAAEDHVALFTLHHIVCDGWSMDRLGREIGVLYGAFSRGLPSPLPELPVQYADYAVWQRGWLQGDVLEGQLAYWRRKLGGPLPPLDLPTDRPRPAVRSFRGGREAMRLPAEVHEGVLALGRREGATLFMVLLAAFNTLLYRYGGQLDILVGTPVANRRRAETEGLIGFFVNNLALRTDLSGNPTFRELLGRVRETTLEAFTHQDVPFEKLVEELQPERSKETQPLYRVVFTLQQAAAPNADGADGAAGLALSGFKTETGASKVDLLLSTTAGPGGLTGALEYDADLFERGTIQQIAAHFAALLQAVVRNPDEPLIDIPLGGPDAGQSGNAGESSPDDGAEEFSFVV